MKKIAYPVIILSLAIFGFFAIKNVYPRTNNQPEDKKEEQDSQQTFEAINGVLVKSDISGERPLAVMVENHPDARPQSGLSDADVVYETLAEGGITRFEAIYQSQEVNEIGPVRSARDYFAQIADEWGALYAHVGGSNEVITQLKDGNYPNLADANEYYNGDFLPRRKDKPQPHNVFTSTEKLRELITFHQFSNAASYRPWLFKGDQQTASSTAADINIDFSRAGYEVGWQYDLLSNSYKRSIYFQPDIDAENNRQITAKNVVVQIVDVQAVPGDLLLHVNIDTSSGGRATVFLDGTAIEGAWKKENGRTRFYDSQNQEIKFNRGLIWIEMVPKEKEINLSWK